jgi:hypothetical protein
MANGNTGRRAVLTVDLDCERCNGRGFFDSQITIGWGSSAQTIRMDLPCRCLLPAVEVEAANDKR